MSYSLDFKAPQELWNPLSKAIPGKFHRFDGHSKCNCFQDQANFKRTRAWQIVLIFNTVLYITLGLKWNDYHFCRQHFCSILILIWLKFAPRGQLTISLHWFRKSLMSNRRWAIMKKWYNPKFQYRYIFFKNNFLHNFGPHWVNDDVLGDNNSLFSSSDISPRVLFTRICIFIDIRWFEVQSVCQHTQGQISDTDGTQPASLW